jgi:hypothetical protein
MLGQLQYLLEKLSTKPFTITITFVCNLTLKNMNFSLLTTAEVRKTIKLIMDQERGEILLYKLIQPT